MCAFARKGRTQCIFPRSQHSCLYVYIYWPTVNLYQVVVGQQSVRTLFKSLAQLFCKCFFFKWPLVAILDVQFIISYQYHNFYFCDIFLQNGCRRPYWMSEKSLSVAFLAISDQYETFFNFFYKMATGAHFGCPKFTFDRISGHFRSIGHFGFPKFAFDRNSGHFRSIQNFLFGGHFGCPKMTLDRISGHFRSIGHFGCPKFTFDGISGHFRSIRYMLRDHTLSYCTLALHVQSNQTHLVCNDALWY